MCTVLEAIANLKLSAEKKIWIAFSGGLDSTVLLHACLTVLGTRRCLALHINHQLSPDSESWVRHCEDQAERWGVELFVDCSEIAPGNLEQQARLARYSVFRKRLKPDQILFTAHHQNDDVETLTWQLFTGRALIGIPSRRQLGAGAVSRPFLHLKKQTIENYARQHGLEWIEDESNAATKFDRNWLRHELLPQISNRFPLAVGRLLELKQATLSATNREPLVCRDVELTVELIRSWLLAYSVNPPTIVLNQIIAQVDARSDASPEIKVADGIFVRRFRDQLYVVPDCEVFKPLVVKAGESKTLSNGTLTWEECDEGFSQGQKFLCTNRAHLPNKRRVIRHEDLHKKFANLFQEWSIPPWLRAGWPVLIEGDAVVCLVDLVTDTTATGWQTSPAFVPRWYPHK